MFVRKSTLILSKSAKWKWVAQTFKKDDSFQLFISFNHFLSDLISLPCLSTPHSFLFPSLLLLFQVLIPTPPWLSSPPFPLRVFCSSNSVFSYSPWTEDIPSQDDPLPFIIIESDYNQLLRSSSKRSNHHSWNVKAFQIQMLDLSDRRCRRWLKTRDSIETDMRVLPCNSL